jgi:hypothetical protein
LKAEEGGGGAGGAGEEELWGWVHDTEITFPPVFISSINYQWWYRYNTGSVSDPHRFYADPDPDPAFLLNADPDPDPTCRI